MANHEIDESQVIVNLAMLNALLKAHDQRDLERFAAQERAVAVALANQFRITATVMSVVTIIISMISVAAFFIVRH
jgi:hypothetical protein